MDFKKGYVEALLEGGNDLSKESDDAILEDCMRFDAENKKFLLENYLCDFRRAGRDFWFARQRQEVNALTPFCKKYPPLSKLIAKNGVVFIW